MLKKILTLTLVASFAGRSLSQQPADKSSKADSTQTGLRETVKGGDVDLSTIPEKVVTFYLAAGRNKIPISPVTSVPLCDSDGFLLLDLLDPKDMNKHTLISMKGDKSQTYLPSAISDLHDISFRGFYSAGSMVAYLVHGTRQSQRTQSGSKSPAGFDWRSYHEYLAKFKRDGSYEGSVELAVNFPINHIGLFPSGEILAVGYDQLNSAPRLVLLSSSGEMVRSLDLPAGRRQIDDGLPYGSGEAAMAYEMVVGLVSFTPYKNNILVWRGNSDDPVLEVQPGGATREVTLHVPKEFTFVQIIPSTDGWVAHFRRKDVRDGAPFDRTTYSYFEVRPEDGTLSTKLTIGPSGPPSIACEAEGNYITYYADNDNNIAILNSK